MILIEVNLYYISVYTDFFFFVIVSNYFIDYTLVACHNVASCDIAKEIIKTRGLDKSSVCFGQLKGFSDALTFSLADDGYNVLKYLPYGPTEFLIPYLIRRGNESKQVLREHLFLNDISAEIKRRLTLK
jgi:proline dehydrogenase